MYLKFKGILLITFLFFFLTAINHGQTIPGDRSVDWTLAGCKNSLPEPDLLVNILDFGGNGDSLTDNTPALENAIEALNGKYGIVYFPEGTYLIKSSISLTDSVIIRGASSDMTELVFDLGEQALNCFSVSKGQTEDFSPLNRSLAKGIDVVEVLHPEFYTAGGYAEIRQENGSWDTNPISWADHSVGQVLKIQSVENNELMLKNPLRINYDEELQPEIRPLEMITHVGIECLKLSRADMPPEGAGYNFYFANAADCHIKGVESNVSVGSHIYLTNSTNVEVSGCYIHDACTYCGTGTRGYGLTLNMHSGECLIENNIFKHLRHAMVAKTGANGNVFAYNYSIEPYRVESIHDFSGDISLHGHYAFSNLFEGNIVQNIIVDHYWGPSGPYNTFFRNRAELYGFILTNSDTTQTCMQNIIGNEITNPGNFYGNYMITGTEHYEYGNNVLNNIVPAGTGNLDDESYYLEGYIDFWDISDPWPSIGIPNDLDQYTNPAKQRFIAGGQLTVCDDPVFTGSAANINAPKHDIYPNPCRGILNFRAHNNIREITVLNAAGHLVDVHALNGESYALPHNIPNGLLIIRARGESETSVHKIILQR